MKRRRRNRRKQDVRVLPTPMPLVVIERADVEADLRWGRS
jgi:hypothetical protein